MTTETHSETHFTESGSSPPAPPTPPTTNYTVNVVRFKVARETARETAQATPAALNNPAAVAALVSRLIPDDAREHFGVLLLNAQNKLVAYHEVSVGTLSASLVHPREVFGPALRVLGVASIVLAHNHPSGDVTPSKEDIRLTRQLVEAGKLLDVPVHDHLVFAHGESAFTSLAERGLL